MCGADFGISNVKKGSSFDQTLINAVESGQPEFVMTNDEWDAPIRGTPPRTAEYRYEVLHRFFNATRLLY